MEKKNSVIANQEMVEYLEGLHFRYRSLEMVMKMQFIPSKYIEIDTNTKEFYLEKFNEARAAYLFALNEIKEHYFPESKPNDAVDVDFRTCTVTLSTHGCNCGGNCSV